MAWVDDLIGRVRDDQLRADLTVAVERLRDGLSFGLVFEEHEPEVLPTPQVPVSAGSLAVNGSGQVVQVESVQVVKSEQDGGPSAVATVLPWGGDGEAASEDIDLAQLTSAVRLGDPVFPVLRPISSVTGPKCEDDIARHIAIEAENYLALKLFANIYAGRVDCIYIDPPYNSGATDWKYNNRFVEESDRYRHSKWLSMMQRRLKLAARMLKPDGVLIVTIDENEVHHLAVLLRQLFPAATHQMVTVVINSSGSPRSTFSRVEEHALFVFSGDKLSEQQPTVCKMSDNLLTDADTPDWFTLLRSNENSLAANASGLVYPIWIDPNGQIIGTGRTLADRVKSKDVPNDPVSLNGYIPPDETPPEPEAVAIWPRSRSGIMYCWSLSPDTLMENFRKGYVYVRVSGGAKAKRRTIYYLREGRIESIEDGSRAVELDPISGEVARDPMTGAVSLKPADVLKAPMTVWNRDRHGARYHGTTLLRKLLGQRRFPYPKSLYSTLDAVASVVKDRPDAVVMDFFAGSGTTLHAVAALNQADGGSRQCVVVSNNEVSVKEAEALREKGLAPGHPDWERLGIFRYVLMPRVSAAITGRRPDGALVGGKYLPPLYKRSISDGFPAAVEFFKLECADPIALADGDCFDEIHPLLWAQSGGHGPCPTQPVGNAKALRKHEPGWLLPGDIIPAGCRYGVLLRPARLSGFLAQLDEHPELSHVFVDAADSGELHHVSELIGKKSPDVEVVWLYEHLRRRLGEGGD